MEVFSNEDASPRGHRRDSGYLSPEEIRDLLPHKRPRIASIDEGQFNVRLYSVNKNMKRDFGASNTGEVDLGPDNDPGKRCRARNQAYR